MPVIKPCVFYKIAWFPMREGDELSPALWDQICVCIHNGRQKVSSGFLPLFGHLLKSYQGNVLVHCREGRCRSVAVLIAYCKVRSLSGCNLRSFPRSSDCSSGLMRRTGSILRFETRS
jgi:hypothetical protein